MNNISDNSSETDSPSVKPQTGSRTNWERFDTLSNEEIDTSDIPPLTEEDFSRSQWRFPASARSSTANVSHAVVVEVAIDEDILAWFQSQGQDYPQRMRAALRLYAEAHQASALQDVQLAGDALRSLSDSRTDFLVNPSLGLKIGY